MLRTRLRVCYALIPSASDSADLAVLGAAVVRLSAPGYLKFNLVFTQFDAIAFVEKATTEQ